MHPKVIGLIAGEGQFPLLFAKAAGERGVKIIAFAVSGLTNKEIEQYAPKTHWLEVNEFIKLINLFHAEGVEAVAMTGRVPHSLLLKHQHFDDTTLELLASLPDKKADSILSFVAKQLRREGIEVIDSSLFLKDCLAAAGLLTRSRPLTLEEEKDIKFGFPLAKQVAGLDIGQTIVIKNQIVVAVEAIEGTDATIKRAGRLAGQGTVVIKVSKPQQDLRFDIPIIGVKTIEVMQEVAASALAVSAGTTLFFDQPQALALADKSGIAIVGLQDEASTS